MVFDPRGDTCDPTVIRARNRTATTSDGDAGKENVIATSHEIHVWGQIWSQEWTVVGQIFLLCSCGATRGRGRAIRFSLPFRLSPKMALPRSFDQLT
jgi:hypothetical protein